jgi:hypothetical protein
MDSINTLSVLSGQSRRRGHGIAAMRRNHFLIGFEAPARLPSARCVLQLSKRKSQPHNKVKTHAPPELSEPAITRMRFMVASLCVIAFFDGNGSH